MTIDIKLNVNTIKTELASKKQKAQRLLDHMVLNDSDKYAPQATGTLRKKGFDTVLGSGYVTWNVPYAKEVYHKSGEPSLLKNPNARRKWFEVAKAERLKEWERRVQNEFN